MEPLIDGNDVGSVVGCVGDAVGSVVGAWVADDDAL